MRKYTLFSNKLLQALRIEELIGIGLIGFALLFASFSNLYMFINDLPEAQNIVANISRILVSTFFIFVFCRSILVYSENRGFQIFRDFAPFLFVLFIFFNLQDAIFIINPQDIHHTLVDLDERIFGIQPTVWAERFYHPRLTDWFAFTYLNFYFMTLILLGLLYQKKRYEDFRVVVVTVMISQFIGFIGYIIFPAESPYLVIPELYEVDIWKDTTWFSWLTYTIVDMSPYRVRDAFPSMHNATVLLTMILACRYHRTYFWIQLPLVISLPFATVYLRYHYVVDIIGALPVIAAALYISPRLEQKWIQIQKRITSFEDSPAKVA
ncbi:MAG: phosphatase PAP2 family protein [FCB group bacterium]|nr:phosphatase PAP2 family protein [FCB group bacterium]MBL7029325.1 phosphatase PAP2 family protein [Candidatus Neomarinimicrobiota bacterium]MBL7122647.1 phosphatase PAP2 family protein [Candidatus Neomarinimicrobiota bacterium]